MKLEKKLLENSTIELIIEEKTENIAKYRKNVMKYLKKNSEIKGFRKGAEIPESIIVRNHGEEKITSMTIEAAIDELYKKAVMQEKIVPVAQAEIREVVSQSPLKFIVHIEILPEIEISDKYKKIKLEKTTVAVSAKEVNNALDEIQTKFTNFKISEDSKAKAVMGDRITIDTDGFDEKGIMMESTSMRGYPLVLGSNMLVPGFEEKIVGAKQGDELDLDIDFPKDYHNADFAGKKTKFNVKIISIEKAVKPEFTSEFIKQLRGKELDLAGFKKLIKSEINDTKISNARIADEEKLIAELLNITKIEVGPRLLAANIDKVYSEIKENLIKDEIKPSDYLDSLKMTEEQYKEVNVKPTALKRLQGELILNKLKDMMDIEVEDKELTGEIKKISARFENEEVLKRLEDMYKSGTKQYEELRERLKYSKIIDSFFVETKKTTVKK